MENTKKTLTINGHEVEIGSEKNLLEMIRKIGIELPTFCYHSELSAYGACRLCLVEVEGRGIMASCSTAPEAGMKIRTDSKQLREMRKINIELLLANHKRECPSCIRSYSCTLQNLARRLGVEEIRYKQITEFEPIDESSPSLTRDPNKCVLCGDCVRMCKEVQGIGAIDFTHRGSHSKVAPAFEADLASVECINCGQCVQVCPTGALTPKQEREDVWKAIHDPNKVVVASIAPAVRVGIGEYCCPGWVKYAETNFPELNKNLSTCRSPQQMFGSIAKEALPTILNVPRENIVVVSIMPCTAKKFEAKLDKFKTNGVQDVDYVITTAEVGTMIHSFGIHFAELEAEAFDMPLGFGTGAGVIFGTSGGVMEAALRYAAEKINGKVPHAIEFPAVRGSERFKETEIKAGDKTLKIAVVNTLSEARKVASEAAAGKSPYHFIEVMACPGGCVCGGGQPITTERASKAKRMNGLYKTDKNMQFQKSQDNPTVIECYEKFLDGKPNSHKAHELLHTGYENRDSVFDARYLVQKGSAPKCVSLAVCVTPANDAEHKAEKVLTDMITLADTLGVSAKVDIEAAFAPASAAGRKAGEVMIGTLKLDGADTEAVRKALTEELAKLA